MALELENLVFSVSTGQLDDARIKLAKLGDAVNALNKPMQDMARSSAKTNEVIAKSELAAEKARQAQKALAEEVQDAGEKMSRVEKNLQKVTTGLQIFRGETVNVKDASVNLGDSFTKSQANFLAMQLQLGATAEQLKSFAKEFIDFNKMTSTNTFDNSIRGLNKLKQETKELAEVDKLMRDGIALTKDQIVNLTRDSERLTQAYKSMKKTDDELSSALLKLREDTIEAAKAKNTFIEAAKQSEMQAKKEADAMLENARAAKLVNDKMMQDWSAAQGAKSPALQEMSNFYKEQERLLANGMTTMDQAVLKYRELEAARNKASSPRSISEQAAAEAYLAKETERVNRLIESKGEITSSTNNRLIKYEQALKASGVSSEVAAAKLAKYKEQLLETQKVAGNRQMDYLSRALGPQITDIFVGLATGQNPMTVLLQQGGQLRDQFALAGVEGANMGKALTTAFASMYDSTKNVAIAVGTMLVGGFAKVGRAASDMVGSVVPDVMLMDKAMEALSKRFPELSRVFSAVEGSFKTAMGATIIAAVTSLSIALYQVIKEQDAFAKQLALTSGSLGFTQQSAVDFAKAMTTVEVSTTEAVAVMSTMAKTGGFVRDEIQMVTDTAVQMNKWLGVSVEDTVKQYAKLKEDPVKAINEIAKTTGLIPVAVLETVRALKEQGNESEAASVAMKAYADVAVEQIGRVKQEYSAFATLMIELGATLGKFWDGIKAIWYKDSPTNRLKSEIDVINSKINSWGIGGDYKKELEGQRAELTKQLLLLENANMQEEQRVQKQAEQAKWMADNSKALDKNLSKQEKWKIKQKELADDFATGIIASQETYDKALAGWKRLILGEDKKPKKDPAIEQLKKDLDVFNDLMNKSEGQNKSYNNNLEALNRLRKEGKITQEQYNDALGYLVRSQPGYVKKMHELTQSAEDYDKAVKDVAKTVKEWSDSADVEAEKLNLRQKLLGLSAEEQARVNAEYDKYSKLKKLDLDLENALNAAKSKFTTEDFEQVQKPKIIAANAKLRENVERESSIKIAEQQIEEFNKTRDAISGAIADALFEGGKKGADSLKNYLKTTFRKFVIDVFINPIVGSIMSSAASAIGLNPSSSSTTGQLIGAAKTGSNVYSAVTGGFAKAGAYASMAFDKIAATKLGQQLGLSSNVNVGVKEIDATTGNVVSDSTVSSPQPTATGEKLSANIGQMATSIAAAFVAQGLRKAISGGFKMNKGLEKITDIANIAAGFAGPFTQIVTGVVSGIASRAFGTKLTQTGIQGTFGGTEGFTGSRYTFEKGGWFRRDKTRYQPLEEEIRTAMALSFAVTKSEVQKFSEYLGIGAEALSNFSYQIKVNLMGLSEDDAVKTMQGVFNKMKDAMAAAVLAGKNYTKEGETQYQTLERLATTVYTVNSMFKDFGASLLDTGFAGVDAALAYSEYFGGLDKLSASLSSFYDKFYTDSEKVNNLSRNLTDAFSALGFEMPKTRDEFKKLVLSVIELGDPALLKDVLSLQDGFVSMTETAVNSFKELTDGIQSEIDRLLGANLTSASSTIQGSAMRTEFDVLSALARGGDATALAKLPEFSQAIEKNMTDFASSASDVIFARAMLAQSLSDTMSSLGGNTTIVPTSVSGLSGSTSIATTGAADLTASVTSQGDLMSVLIAEIQGLRAEVRADVSANTKTSKILERANQDGETISVTVVA